MDGVELAARFGSVTNNLKYCGPSDFQTTFRKYLNDKNETNSLALQNAIRKFEAHYPYLKLIADSNDLDPFDYEVCGALWLGNELLENVKIDSIKTMILKDLTGEGKLPQERAEMLASSIPNNSVPHHSFHVYYIKFITGKVPWNLENADKCRVPFGKILDSNGKIGRIRYKPVVKNEGKFRFGEEKDIEINMGLIGDASIGDAIAFHWGVAIKKLTEREIDNLEKYTLRNLDAINSA